MNERDKTNCQMDNGKGPEVVVSCNHLFYVGKNTLVSVRLPLGTNLKRPGIGTRVECLGYEKGKKCGYCCEGVKIVEHSRFAPPFIEPDIPQKGCLRGTIKWRTFEDPFRDEKDRTL